MKKLTAFLVTIALIGCSINVYMPTAGAMNTVSMLDYSKQIEDETAEKPDLEADYKTVTEGDFTFDVYENFAYLTKFADTEAEEVEIPAEINGIPVIGLTDTPFGYCRKLKTVIFPDSLQYFDWLDVVGVTQTVHSSSSGATVVVGSTLEEIDEDTTSAPTLINSTAVAIMADENADEDIIYPSVAEIKISETNPYFTVSDGILYSKDMKKVIGCPPALEMTELKISDKAELINDYAFATCYNLKKAVIPENIKQINNAAFAACTALESVELPKSINAVYMDTFYLCESLTNVKFNSEIWAIGSGAFNGCKSLTSFDIPDSVYYLGRNPFDDTGCIEVKNGIHYVDNWAVGTDMDIENIVFEEGTVGVAEMICVLNSDYIKLIDFPDSVNYVGDLAIADTCYVTNEIHYRASYLNERTLAGSKSTSDFYIYDKDCDIFDSEKTIPTQYKVTEPPTNSLESDNWITSSSPTITADESDTEVEKELENAVVIHGYAGSTAQAYAEKYNRKFVLIEEEPAEIVAGDANGDGVFNIADAVTLQKWILGSSDATLENPEIVDLCKDGKIDVFDMCLLREKLVK